MSLGISLGICMGAGSFGGAAPEPSTPRDTLDAPAHVDNPSTPLRAAITLPLERLWTLGADPAREGEFFGVIADVHRDEAGATYLLDQQLARVQVFSESGRYLRTIGREGEGPGEFRRPAGLLQLPDGRLAVIQSQPPKLILFDKDGTPAGQIIPAGSETGHGLLRAGHCRDESVVLLSNRFRFLESTVERTRRLFRIDPQGRTMAVFDESLFSHTRGQPLVSEIHRDDLPWAVAPDGSVVANATYDYQILFWDAAGRLTKMVSRVYAPHRRSRKEKAIARDRLDASVRITGPQGRIHPDLEVSDYDRAIHWLAVHDDGCLWVLPESSVREQEKGLIGPFDIFDEGGRYIQSVTLLGPADLEDDRLFLSGEWLYVLSHYASARRAMLGNPLQDAAPDTGPMVVTCYSLPRRPPPSE